MIHAVRAGAAPLGTSRTTLGGQTVSYAVRRSSRAKHVRLEVRARTGLTVVIPSSYDVDNVPGMLSEKGRWILDKLAKYATGNPVARVEEPRSGDFIPYLGRRLLVVTRRNHGTADGVRLEKDRLFVHVSSRNGRLNLALEWWYRQQSEKLIRKRADELRHRVGVAYGRLTVRGAKTRWGSCSHKGNINLNWKLVMVPKPVIDYVIIHELTHLKEMNHSGKFWQLVAECCPQWRKHRQWLRDHEAELFAGLWGQSRSASRKGEPFPRDP